MPDIKIIDKVDVPEGYNKWRNAIDSLGLDKAIKVACPDKVTVEKLRNSILGNFRTGRLSKSDYRLRTRVSELGEFGFALFIWKEIKAK